MIITTLATHVWTLQHWQHTRVDLTTLATHTCGPYNTGNTHVWTLQHWQHTRVDLTTLATHTCGPYNTGNTHVWTLQHWQHTRVDLATLATHTCGPYMGSEMRHGSLIPPPPPPLTVPNKPTVCVDVKQHSGQPHSPLCILWHFPYQ